MHTFLVGSAQSVLFRQTRYFVSQEAQRVHPPIPIGPTRALVGYHWSRCLIVYPLCTASPVSNADDVIAQERFLIFRIFKERAHHVSGVQHARGHCILIHNWNVLQATLLYDRPDLM